MFFSYVWQAAYLSQAEKYWMKTVFFCWFFFLQSKIQDTLLRQLPYMCKPACFLS